MRNSRRGNGAAIAAAAFTSAQSPIHARAPSATAVCLVVATFFLLLSTSRSALASSSAANGNGNGLATEQQQQQELEQTVKDDEPPDTDPTKKSPVEAPISAAAGLEQNQQQYNGHQHIQLPSKQNIQPHASFLTMDKKAHLSGIRIEPEEPGEAGFIGYNEKGVSIVAPQTPVRVVLFGSFLDDIVLIGFTPNENCSQTLANIHQEDFTIQTERRIVVIHEFEESKSIYKICLKQKVNGDVYDLPFSLVDDLRCSVSTDMPPRKYYFPIGVQISIVAGLLVLSGLFSGLNLGLMSLTPQELTLISNSGSLKERRYAQTILPVRKSGNLLLCSLLIGNVCVNSAISILFDDLTSGYVALVVSSAGIVIFGEIFPQALCVKKGLAVGAHTIWVTRFFMVLTFPLAYPISRVLDYLLGDEVVSYDRKRLMELIKLSTKNAIGCPAEELKIAIGAFEMGDKTVKDVMTKIDDVFMIPQDTVLNAKVVAEILRSGYTRIPVYGHSRDNVISLLFVKDLALLDPDDNFVVKTVCDYYQHPVRRVPENTPLRSMLEEFKKGDYHMALVDRQVESLEEKEMRYELVGLVTLEDIVEEILQAEIVDETDVVTDNVHRTRRRRNHHRDLDLFIDDGGACQISMQMQLVTIQYLEGNFRAFNPNRIAQNILEKVIRAHVHKVEVSHLTDLNDPKTALPKKAKLYTKKLMSDKFVLVLEGRALVTIGQNEMTFEVGPWQCFGTELLHQLDQLIDMVEQQQNSSASNSLLATTTTIRTVTSASGAIDRLESIGGTIGVGGARPSQGAVPVIIPAATTISVHQQPLVDLIGQDQAKKIKFVPDYSVKILSECTYLEISVQTYLAMYRSTLITRNKEGLDGGGPTGGHHPAESNFERSGGADSVAIGTSTATGTVTPQHAQPNQQPQLQQQQTFESSDMENLVDNFPVVANNNQILIEQREEKPLEVAGNGTIGGVTDGHMVGKMKRMPQNDSSTRHRRTNSDTTNSLLLPNGASRAPTDLDDEDGAAVQIENAETDLELGEQKNCRQRRVD